MVGSNTWMYRPGLRTPLRISAQQRVFGDAGVGEAAGILFSADYTVTEAREETLDGSPSWRLDLEARSRSAPYRRATVWIDRQQGRYRRAILYSVSGVPLKQLEYEQWGEVSGRKALVRMAVRDLLQGDQGTVTLIETVAIRARTIPPRYFRPDFLSSAALLLGE
ncbi:MAG: outer membrane lipoprotein-sorting protein [Limnochordaceae bacterium]|nr:outer membrane lipoprotein-sorting protein [Limnochordaceae bacterium]